MSTSTFVQNFTTPPEAVCFLNVGGAAALQVEKTVKASGKISLASLSSLSSLSVLGEIEGAISFGGSCFLRNGSEPNVFLEATSAIDFVGDAAAEIVQTIVAVASMNFTGEAALNVLEAESASCLFQVQIVPAASSSGYQKYLPRFSADGEEILIKSFRLEFPNNTIGAKLDVELAEAASELSNSAIFKFEIKIGAVWHTLLDTGALERESFSTAVQGDNLRIDVSSPIADKLNLAPRAPRIYFDPAKTSVDLSESDVLKDESGNSYPIAKTSVGGLSLYYLLQKVFVEGCGFSSYQTNIPDYKIARADFSPDASFLQSVSGFLGMFEPVFFEQGNILYIIDTSNALPAGFTPRSLTASRFTNFSSNAQKRSLVDGFIVNFSASEGEYFTTRLETSEEASGNFGEPGYTRTDIEKTIREYRSFQNPNVVLRSEVQSERRETYDWQLNKIGDVTETRSFNAQGRIGEIRKTVDALVPDLSNSGTPALLNVRSEVVTFSYKPNPKNPREILQDKIITQIRGLIAVDSENQYFDEDFKQDLLEAHKAGNLTANMTSEFGAIRTITETLEFDSTGQTSIRIQTIDHVRGFKSEEVSDVRGGAGSFSQYQQNRRVIVFRDGANASAAAGARLENFSAGELPSRHAIALAKRRLNRQSSNNKEASIEVIGVDLSIRRGASLRILNRNAQSLGNFLCGGYVITGSDLGTNPKLMTGLSGIQV